ncbi:class I SAM-dependent methyltransferase [Corynebacterium tapiri]|uniref:Class I SAM-dependent methyltransferase n=1 Tax=Corynebacterium tapiri TaxID=1448266 RepID=A0A5C4U5Z2_9CORY|nr:class I SAM-dependent methyltransferase [Corynebacterium tapiri]TNL99829.1 class I SAM-dependent methyltransferase [Corynebacterium tapiri]
MYPTDPDQESISLAGRQHWDSDAQRYQEAHANYLADFHWCPERVREADVHLLGDVRGARVLEVGCGTAPCSQWVANQGAQLAVGVDISREMLRGAESGPVLAQADCLHLPFADSSFDIAFSVFGGLPFVRDVDAALQEIHRVIGPDAPFVFSVNHPMRWVFPDDPGPHGLVASLSYFDREYIERDADGAITYAEFHRTFADWIAVLTRTGFRVEKVIEPEWPDGLEENFGQWSPLRGRIFPGSIIWSTRTF